MAGSGDENIGKKIGKLETGGLRASISRSPASYLQFPGGEMGQGTVSILRWSHQEVHQAMLPKGNTGHVKGVRDQKHSSLVADNSGLLRG